MKAAHASHTFPGVYDESSRILILGSFPSVASRDVGFFYGHRQNRFWKVLAHCLKEKAPQTIEEKKAMCLKHHIALYDSIESCDIEGSSDSSIRNVEPANLEPFFEKGKIEKVIFNGKASEKWFYAFQQEKPGTKYVVLPSTSAANATFSLEKLCDAWSVEFSE